MLYNPPPALGPAQLDRFANLNSTVIGDRPITRLPVAADPRRTDAPTEDELEALRELLAR